MTFIIHCPCRKCPKCLARRGWEWSLRARSEWARAKRTWFGTITLNPSSHHLMLARARSHEATQGVDFDLLPVEEQFGLRHRQIAYEFTKYFKRLRKETQAPLRYLLVCEAHKSGLPHYHALVHELHVDLPVRHSELQKQWKLGFTSWKLVTDVKQATYVTKYLNKSSMARVRASLNYGKQIEMNEMNENDKRSQSIVSFPLEDTWNLDLLPSS